MLTSGITWTNWVASIPQATRRTPPTITQCPCGMLAAKLVRHTNNTHMQKCDSALQSSHSLHFPCFLSSGLKLPDGLWQHGCEPGQIPGQREERLHPETSLHEGRQHRVRPYHPCTRSLAQTQDFTHHGEFSLCRHWNSFQVFARFRVIMCNLPVTRSYRPSSSRKWTTRSPP